MQPPDRPQEENFQEEADLQVPTALLRECRMNMYPVSRTHKGEVLETVFGTVRYERGALSAYHRDIMLTIRSFAERSEYNAIGGVDIWFDVAKIAKIMGVNSNWKFLREKLIDMKAVAIVVKSSDEEKEMIFSVLDYVGDSDQAARRKWWQFQGTLKKISLSPYYCRLMGIEPSLIINPALVVQMLQLKNQVSRSVAVWMMSQSEDQHHKTNSLLEVVGCKGDRKMFCKFRKGLKEDADGLKGLGIVVGDGVVYYNRNSGVFFCWPDESAAEKMPTPESVVRQIPAAHKGLKGVAQNMPLPFFGEESVAQNVPLISGKVESVAQNMPCVAQNVPCVAQNMPCVAQNVPSFKDSFLKIVFKDNDIGEDFLTPVENSNSLDGGEMEALQNLESGSGKIGLFEFRSMYEEYFGSPMVGGMNNSATQICMRHTVGEIKEAFKISIDNGALSFKYFEKVLETMALRKQKKNNRRRVADDDDVPASWRF